MFVCEAGVAPGETCVHRLVQEYDVVCIRPSRIRWSYFEIISTRACLHSLERPILQKETKHTRGSRSPVNPQQKRRCGILVPKEPVEEIMILLQHL